MQSKISCDVSTVLFSPFQVYHIASGTYITHEQLYGRSLTKETIKNGMELSTFFSHYSSYNLWKYEYKFHIVPVQIVSKVFCFFFAGLARFFHNGEELRKDAISLSIHKIRKILHWFEGQKQLHFYASSLLFVYEGCLYRPNTKNISVTLTGKRHRQAELENKCNADLTSSKLKSSFGQVSCNSILEGFHYVRKANGFGSHSLHHQAKGITADMEANINTAVENKSSNGRKDENVEVKMIDFAHVFPSNSSDDGYMYGLKSLLFVLEQILQD